MAIMVFFSIEKYILRSSKHNQKMSEDIELRNGYPLLVNESFYCLLCWVSPMANGVAKLLKVKKAQLSQKDGPCLMYVIS